MGFVDEARAHTGFQGAKCGIGKVLDQMAEKDAAEVVAAMALPQEDLQSAAIARALTDRGYRINPGTVARHRKGGCSCHQKP